mmetsp:Transcript_24720/g.46173  ORF Transcript_24720/g.46173 Transcript_24720/m.46173 type:complete len:239 (-) Transcript_24720:416-1132(-)
MPPSPRVPAMAAFDARLSSFGDSWPHGSSHYATPTLLAMSGFFHSPGGQHRDRCICYHCGVALVGWEEDDEPSVEHRVHSPACPVINGEGVNPTGSSRRRSDKEPSSSSRSKRGGLLAVSSASKAKGSELVARMSKEKKKSLALGTQKRKRLRMASTMPYFDRLRQRRRKEGGVPAFTSNYGGTGKSGGSDTVEPEVPSEFRAFAAMFLRKILLSTLKRPEPAATRQRRTPPIKAPAA